MKYAADLHITTLHGWTILHSAVLSGHERIVKALVENDSKLINMQNTDGFAALHLAAGLGRKSIVKVLVENGAEVEIQANAGQTPSYLAKQSGNFSNVKSLSTKSNIWQAPFFQLVSLRPVHFYFRPRWHCQISNKPCRIDEFEQIKWMETST